MINIIIILIIITHIYIYTELVGPNRTPCTLWFGGPKPVYLLVIKTNSTYIFINIYILNWWVQFKHLVHYGLVGPNPVSYIQLFFATCLSCNQFFLENIKFVWKD